MGKIFKYSGRILSKDSAVEDGIECVIITMFKCQNMQKIKNILDIKIKKIQRSK